jgi:hypothetical protein
MTVKKKYNIGDTVWIYGITNGKSTQGIIVQTFTVDQEGWDQDRIHYVVSVPTEIEPLIEVRTWETISQDKNGYVGAMRDTFEDTDAALKLMRRTGLTLANEPDYTTDEDEHDDPSPDQIHKALIKSQTDVAHAPLVYKDNTKPARKRYPPRKKKI